MGQGIGNPSRSDSVREVMGVKYSGMSVEGCESVSTDTHDRVLGWQPHPAQHVVPKGLNIDDTTDALVFSVPCPVAGAVRVRARADERCTRRGVAGPAECHA